MKLRKSLKTWRSISLSRLAIPICIGRHACANPPVVKTRWPLEGRVKQANSFLTSQYSNPSNRFRFWNNKMKEISIIKWWALFQISQNRYISKQEQKILDSIGDQLAVGTPGCVMTRAVLPLADANYLCLPRSSYLSQWAICTKGVWSSGGEV